MVEAKYLLTS